MTGTRTYSVTGTLGALDVTRLRAAIESRPTSHSIVVDLREVTEFEPAALRSLCLVLARLAVGGLDVTVHADDQLMHRQLHVLGAGRLLSVHIGSEPTAPEGLDAARTAFAAHRDWWATQTVAFTTREVSLFTRLAALLRQRSRRLTAPLLETSAEVVPELVLDADGVSPLQATLDMQ